MLTLIQLNPAPDKKPKTFHVDGGKPVFLGRQTQGIVLKDSRISRRHAEVSVQNGVWVIRDLESANGTWVNGDRVNGLCELEEGDRLQIGRLSLIVGHVEVDLAMNADDEATEPAPTTEELSAETLVQPDGAPADEDQDDDVIALQAATHESAPSEPSPILSEPELAAAIDGAEFDESDDADAFDDHDRDRVRLENDAAAAAESVDDQANADSSVAPSDEAGHAAALPDGDVDPLDAGFDELDDEDVYAESGGPITPVVPVARPESPLDSGEGDDLLASGSREQEDPAAASAADAASESESAQATGGGSVSAPDDVAEEADDEAPPVVGLSLDLPAPDDAAPDDDQFVADAAAASGAASPVEAIADAVADGLDLNADLEEDQVLDAELAAALADDALEDIPVAKPAGSVEPVAAAAAEDPTEPAATTAQPVGDLPPDAGAQNELVEPESQQDIAEPLPAKRFSWWKSAAALLIVGGVAGGLWAAQHYKNTSIAGRSAESQATPGSNAALADNHSDNHAASTAPPRTTTDTPPPAAPSATNAFGDGPTLAMHAPRIQDPRTQDPQTQEPQTQEPDPTPPAPRETVEPEAADAAAPDENPAVAEAQPDEAAPENPAAGGPELGPEPGPVTVNLDPPTPPQWVAIDTAPAVATTADAAADPATAAALPPTRRIAFVVDASGSMVDSMNQGVLTWLQTAIDGLNETDQFTVLFFQSGDVLEAPPMGLKPADTAARDDVTLWMSPQAGNIRPRGKSNPIDALRIAAQYDVTEVYILSDDKFGERGQSLASVDARDVAGFWIGREVTVHTTQFYYLNSDDRRLESIARRFGGRYEFVEEPAFDAGPGVDLLGVTQ